MKTLALILSVVGGITFSSIAFAAPDWKGYAGAGCLPAPNTANVRNIPGGIANYERNAQMIICPIVRDIETGGPKNL